MNSEAPLSVSQWVVPPSLPQAWLATLLPPDITVPRAPAPRQPDEKESTPPIPPELVGRVCLYGYTVTDNLIETYRAAHFPDDNHGDLLLYNDRMIHRLAERCGLNVSIHHAHGHDHIIWLSYTRGGAVQVKKIPIASKLKRFATELGITETAKWHDVSLE
ncbi:hypothetical protein B0H14DRAFT_2704033 [Mycena olivaceomarginata]|nr:hypothetical protein B0H14DRAFT_3017611 [Mycena olivaceomarginata]KAJ7861137.1 hypothetical protein B0H14DRAFT_2743118 [Mycena olivaceomarginata]KAJ7882236.1 hypothetical protein B0H14DRAFT_2704033 [Mycena olivaceomarginata]